MKKILWLFFIYSISLTGETGSSLNLMKEKYKYDFMRETQNVNENTSIGIGNILEADILLELADEKYHLYNKNFSTYEVKELPKSNILILVMPRIDLLEKHLLSLSKKTGTVYLFIMEKDKLEGEYGDRSYETFMAKKLNEKLPKNVKFYKLTNASVTATGDKNNFEIGNIYESRVYKEQIFPILDKELKTS